jgi:phage terminase large subunit-like protein
VTLALPKKKERTGGGKRSHLALVIPTAKQLRRADRAQLIDFYENSFKLRNDWIRDQVINNDRIDILATEVLGLQVEPFHLALMKYQFVHPENLQLCFRGAGKSTTCTEVKVIHLLLKNPNLRILIASKTLQNACGFLKNIKSHFETNTRLQEIFGRYYDAKRVGKWDEREIEVLPRTIVAKEASVTCVGVEGTVVSKHYDVIISDDLVDEDNSRTKLQREKTQKWFYNTLMPTLEPPDDLVPHRGEHHMLGTRYHYDDLYGHLIKNELKKHHQVIPALDERGRSPWPKKYPAKWFAERRKRAGLIIFNAQYQCDTEAMKGEIFQYDYCQQLSDDVWPDPKTLRIFMGVDLAISEDEKADKFAIVIIGVTKDRSGYYVLDYFEDQLRFSAQTKKILEYYRRWKPIRCGIETNQYQAAQYQTLREIDKDIRLKRIHTDKDKITRAWKLSSLFEDKRMFFRKGSQALLIEHLVLFPNHKYKDLFDGLDLAVTTSKMRRRRGGDRKEPGVI